MLLPLDNACQGRVNPGKRQHRSAVQSSSNGALLPYLRDWNDMNTFDQKRAFSVRFRRGVNRSLRLGFNALVYLSCASHLSTYEGLHADEEIVLRYLGTRR